MARLLEIDEFYWFRELGPFEVVRADELSGIISLHDDALYLFHAVDHELLAALQREEEDEAHTVRRRPPEMWYIRDRPLLFREFAETPPTADGCRAFASKYGFLLDLDHDSEHYRSCWLKDPRGKQLKAVGSAEPLSLWLEAMQLCKRAVSFWDALRGNDVAFLRDALRWCPHGLRYDALLGDGGFEEDSVFDRRLLEKAGVRRGDFIAAGRWLMLYCINLLMEMYGRCEPWIELRDDGNTDVVVRPSNLVGAIALQLALAVEGNKEYRQCPECGAWYEVHPDTARTSKLYCSSSCRVRAYRSRQNEAAKLFKEGISLEELARRFGADTETVRFWVNKNRKNRTRKSLEGGTNQ